MHKYIKDASNTTVNETPTKRHLEVNIQSSTYVFPIRYRNLVPWVKTMSE